jgi:hypothetical protein
MVYLSYIGIDFPVAALGMNVYEYSDATEWLPVLLEAKILSIFAGTPPQRSSLVES